MKKTEELLKRHNKEMKHHFQGMMLDWNDISEGHTMLEANSVLEYIQEFYILKEEEEDE